MSPLLAQPLAGGAVRRVLGCMHKINFALGASGIYYAACGEGSDRQVRPLDRSGADRALGTIRDTIGLGYDRLAVSPDERTILVHRESLSSDLMLIEKFR